MAISIRRSKRADRALEELEALDEQAQASDADDLFDDDLFGDDEPVTVPVVAPTSGKTGKMMVPANNFDLLEGAGRSRRKTTRMNLLLAGVVLLVIAGSVFITYRAIDTRDSATEQIARLEGDIASTTQAIRQRSSSILSEAELTSHRAERRDIIITALSDQLPYDIVHDDMTAVTTDIGVEVTRVSFEGSDRDDGLVLSGTAADLDTLGRLTTEIGARHGIARVGGYVETIDQTYQSDQLSGELTFNIRMRVNTAQLSLLNGCRRAQLYLDDEVPECTEVLEAFAEAGLGETPEAGTIDPTAADPAASAQDAAVPADQAGDTPTTDEEEGL